MEVQFDILYATAVCSHEIHLPLNCKLVSTNGPEFQGCGVHTLATMSLSLYFGGMPVGMRGGNAEPRIELALPM